MNALKWIAAWVRRCIVVFLLPARVGRLELICVRTARALTRLETSIGDLRTNDLDHLRKDVAELREHIDARWSELVQQVADNRSEIAVLDRRVRTLKEE